MLESFLLWFSNTWKIPLVSFLCIALEKDEVLNKVSQWYTAKKSSSLHFTCCKSLSIHAHLYSSSYYYICTRCSQKSVTKSPKSSNVRKKISLTAGYHSVTKLSKGDDLRWRVGISDKKHCASAMLIKKSNYRNKYSEVLMS